MSNQTKGEKFDRSLETKEVAKRVRQQIRKRIKDENDEVFPVGMKVSVRTDSFSGGSSIDATVTQVPEGFGINNPERVKTITRNPNDVPPSLHQLPELTDAAQAVIDEIESMLGEYRHVDSDLHTDLYNCNFFTSIAFDYKIKGAERAAIAASVSDEDDEPVEDTTDSNDQDGDTTPASYNTTCPECGDREPGFIDYDGNDCPVECEQCGHKTTLGAWKGEAPDNVVALPVRDIDVDQVKHDADELRDDCRKAGVALELVGDNQAANRVLTFANALDEFLEGNYGVAIDVIQSAIHKPTDIMLGWCDRIDAVRVASIRSKAGDLAEQTRDAAASLAKIGDEPIALTYKRFAGALQAFADGDARAALAVVEHDIAAPNELMSKWADVFAGFINRAPNK